MRRTLSHIVVCIGFRILASPADAQEPSSSLEIELSPTNMVRLSWTHANAVVEEIDGLTPTDAWRALGWAPTFIHGRYVLNVPVAGQQRFYRLRLFSGDGLPPDPATTAPALDPTGVTDFRSATEFLYNGPNPVQIGVPPGAIDFSRAAVLRGRVLQRDGAPLAGVMISVLNRPEFGLTATRGDGRFDLAVNGGGLLTVKCELAGYCPAQRQVAAPLLDYATVPDVTLVAMDPAVTPVVFGTEAPPQLARGSVQLDEDGTRRSTLVIPAGTCADLVMPDGSRMPCTGLNVRATEFTVGPTGPSAMPGELPPSSGYTYAVELSADEAVHAGASEVQFNQPIYHYVENFLDFPVGEKVPTGHYDRLNGRWVPSDDGRVIKILAEIGGSAMLDINGDGASDSDAALAALGITSVERQQLASTYDPGQSLWRVPIPHLTPWDCNWPFGPAADAEPPPDPDPDTDEISDVECEEEGNSVIEFENQVLGESLPIVGTSMFLNYRSDRVRGRTAAYTMKIRLSGSRMLPPSIRRIILEIRVAGREFVDTFQPEPNLTYTFVWDGKDAYGRPLNGAQPISIRLCHDYEMQYYASSESFERSFSRFGRGVAIRPVRGGMFGLQAGLCAHWIGRIGLWDARTTGLGGWTIDVHHAYDPGKGRVYLGSGRRHTAESVGDVGGIIKTVVGGGSRFPVDGQEYGALEVSLNAAKGMAAGADGSLYIANGNRVHHVSPDGRFSTVVGTNSAFPGFAGDGGPAAAARLADPTHLALGPDGSLYINDSGNRRIRRVSPEGIITTILGDGTFGSSDDGTPAAEARLAEPGDVAVSADGSLYIVEGNRVRRVGPDGILTTVAGVPPESTIGSDEDGILATLAILYPVGGVATAADGSFYITEQKPRVRRIRPDGIIETVAGDGFGFAGDGGPATAAKLSNPLDIAIGVNGTVFFADTGNYVIRRVRDGIIVTVAGKPNPGAGDPDGDGGPATAAVFRGFTWGNMAMSPGGTQLDVLDLWPFPAAWRVRRIGSALAGTSASDIPIVSPGGHEIYVFSFTGRHLRTLDARTGLVLLTFQYDPAGRLAEIEDRDGNVLSIARDTTGRPTAIVAPHGQRTQLGVNANGYLETLTNPADESVSLSYGGDGLLETVTDPRHNASQFTYDDLGRLIRDAGPDGASTTINLAKMDDAVSLTVTSAMGRVAHHTIERLPTGTTRQVHTDTAGIETEVLRSLDGNVRVSSPAGAVSMVFKPDPRWDFQAPILGSLGLTTPGGLSATQTMTRTVELADPQNKLSLTQQTDIVRLNSRNYTSDFVRASKSFTLGLPSGRRWRTTYDALGRLSEVGFANLAPVRYEYDERGRLLRTTQGTGPEARVTSYAYAANGDLESITDPLGRVRRFAFDAAGRLTGIVRSDGAEVRFGYDATGNLTAITPPGKPAHTLTYTVAGRTASYRAPAIGAEPREMSVTYNLDRQPERIVRPDGQGVTFDYDAAGRLSSATEPGRSTTYSYDPITGAMAGIATAAVTLGYNEDGGLPTSETWSGAVSGSIGWSYNNDLLLSAQRLNGSNEVTYAYNADRQLARAGDLNLSRDALSGFITGATVRVSQTQWRYNSFGEVTGFEALQAGAPLFMVAYSRDKLGRITNEVEVVEGVTRTMSYRYDLAGRLVEAMRDGVIVVSCAYDDNGNRLSITEPAGTRGGMYDDQDRLTQHGTVAFTYTSSGELRTRTDASATATYGYDVGGNLTRVTLPDGRTIEYIVDGRDRRVGKNINGSRVQGFLYEASLRPVAELDDMGNVISRFVFGTRPNVPDYLVKGGRTYRLIVDHRGSPRRVLDAETGEIVQRLEYDVFGNVLLDTNPGFQPFGFGGGLYDRDTGLVRFGARDYDPTVGRWTTKDPVLFAARASNLYTYANNDPVNRVDPTGEVAILAVLAAAWVAVEVGLTILDIVATIDTLLDPCASTEEKLLSAGLTALGLVIPAGGLSASKWFVKPPRGLHRLAKWLGFGERRAAPVLDDVDREALDYLNRYQRRENLPGAELREITTPVDEAFRSGRPSGNITDRARRGRAYDDTLLESWP